MKPIFNKKNKWRLVAGAPQLAIFNKKPYRVQLEAEIVATNDLLYSVTIQTDSFMTGEGTFDFANFCTNNSGYDCTTATGNMQGLSDIIPVNRIRIYGSQIRLYSGSVAYDFTIDKNKDAKITITRI